MTNPILKSILMSACTWRKVNIKLLITISFRKISDRVHMVPSSSPGEIVMPLIKIHYNPWSQTKKHS